jgi:hypothetical protein
MRDPANYIALAMASDGQAAIWRVENGRAAMLADWQPTPIQWPENQPLQLRAVCNGPTLRLSANNILLLEAQDGAPAVGDTALLGGLRLPDEGGLQNEGAGEWRVSMDDLLVTEP